MRQHEFADASVAAVFKSWPQPIRSRLLELRHLIFDVARQTPGVGKLQEALRWGQPSYLTTESGSGSTIRLGPVKNEPARYALYFHCQSGLVENFGELYPGEFTFAGNRSIIFNLDDKLSLEPLRHCICLALTHHLRKGAIKTRRR